MSNDNAPVEATAASLVREYLSRKGLKGTLQKMDDEFPRNELSISNRQALMKHVHLEKLMKKNKEEPEPLKAMLEVMTKHFMERRTPNAIQHTNIALNDGSSLGDFSSDTSFSPQTNQPLETPALKPMPRPNTAALAMRREKAPSDLVMDDDVEGETVIGGGKSGLLSVEETEFKAKFSLKPQPKRPVSATQRGGMIMSNDDALSRRRRSQQTKSTRIYGSQQDQQRKDMTDYQDNNGVSTQSLNGKEYSGNHFQSSPEFQYDKSSPKTQNIIRKQSSQEESPVSFEALLMKGEERANLLQRIQFETKDSVNTSESYKVETSSMGGEKSKQKLKGSSPSTNSTKMMDLEFGDVDDFEENLDDVKLQSAVSMIPKQVKPIKIQSTPIDLKTGINLKRLVLGSPSQVYNDEWLLQSYSFCDLPDIKYGIVQKKGGPCGVLAAVQGVLVQEMLFGENKISDGRFKNLSRNERSKLLALALSNILWRAGDNARAVVTIPSESAHILSSSKFKQDGVTEKLSLYTFTNYQELSSFLIQSVSQFETDGSPGVILTMYSVILSRKPHQVRGDFDVPEETTLIGSHGYCTQELVNLIMTGRAVSNVFNDTVQLDSGGIGDSITLKGISGRSEIGFLSLFEHYKSCQVGTYYKTPKNPIWVVCSESHFSLLFSTRRDLINDWKAERRFDLFYYDGLARQQEEIKLTISTTNRTYKPPTSEEDLIPPLEHCIRTKWTDAEIDWNGYEPIL